MFPIDLIIGLPCVMDGSFESNFIASLFLKLNFHRSLFDIIVFGWIVDQLMDLLQSHPRCLLSEDEEQRFNEIWFTWSIGSNNARELFVEWTNLEMTIITLEIVENNPIDSQLWKFPLIFFLHFNLNLRNICDYSFL